MDDIKASGIHLIIDVVAKQSNFTPEDLRGDSKKRDVAEVRFIAIHLAVLFTRLSKESIGKHFGGRENADVIWAQRQINNRCKVYPELSEKVNSLCDQMVQLGMERKDRPKQIVAPKKQRA